MSAVRALQVRADGWTVDDLEGLPDEGRYELVDGALLVSPPPVVRHEYAVGQLYVALLHTAPEGWTAIPGGGVRFDSANYRGPDAMVVRRSALDAAMLVPADVLLVVEVMSPGTISTDGVAKPAQYAAAGIPAFWRLELDERVLVTHLLDGDVYRETGRHTAGAVVEEPFRVELDVRDLLA